tara:strand:+ start:32 stop:310 length:279 start_codon:yes stop_codon:yes gene_type:complete
MLYIIFILDVRWKPLKPFDDTNHARSPDCKHCKKESRQEEAAPVNALDSSSKLIFTGIHWQDVCHHHLSGLAKMIFRIQFSLYFIVLTVEHH